MKAFVRTHLSVTEWVLGASVVTVAGLVWWSQHTAVALTPYDIFPPLGLAAFGLMWAQYVAGALRRYAGAPHAPSSIFMNVSMALVLALILLHPGILWVSLYLDGFGLPPVSYLNAYRSQLGLVAIGTVALVIFLVYELGRFFGKKSWWRYVQWLQLLAMGLIFIHAIGLGGELRAGWFMLVWVFYGITLVISAVYTIMWDNGRKGEL